MKQTKKKRNESLERKISAEKNGHQYSFDKCVRNMRGFEAMLDQVCKPTVQKKYSSNVCTCSFFDVCK